MHGRCSRANVSKTTVQLPDSAAKVSKTGHRRKKQPKTLYFQGLSG